MIEKNAFIKNPPLPKNFASEFLLVQKGHGIYLEDNAGNRYLDFGAGLAVNALGYGREDLADIACEQMKKLIHISNLYATPPQIACAEKLIATGHFAAVHFGNSGSEANESAIKYGRLYALRTKGPGHHKILCFHNAFHGRTMGALSCTPTPKYQDPFVPLVPGVESIDYNDCKGLEKVLDERFAAVIVEVIQGEGGLAMMSGEFAAKLNERCKTLDIILIADEIQTGLSRTGTLYAGEAVGLEPDIITLAKPLAGGLPMSATLIPEKINDLLAVGEHGTTFGGGPVTTAIANKVLDILTDPAFIRAVEQKGALLKKRLLELSGKFDFLGEVKGKGLLQGVEADCSVEEIGTIIRMALKKGLLILRSGKNVLRIAPPLVISENELLKGCSILEEVLSEYIRTKQ
ncbi:MAG: acetylornithine transaminase [Spirochaetales bacterium]|nr:acetylornithine transaminase [Spirochaetales bacterium]